MQSRRQEKVNEPALVFKEGSTYINDDEKNTVLASIA